MLASAKTQTAFDLGANIILAGLAIQILFFTVFTYMMYQSAYSPEFNLYERPELKPAYQVLFVTTGLIYVRNVFRLVEYAVGHTSYIPTHEWCFFVFESAPMFLVCLTYCFYHFGAMLPDEYLVEGASRKDMKGVSPVATADDLEHNGGDVQMVAKKNGDNGDDTGAV